MRKLWLIVIVFLTVIFLTSNPYVYAESSSDLQKQIEDKQAEITRLENQLKEVKNKEKTLNSQLGLIDGQTKVTTLKIEETTLKIEKLKREINDLSGRINRISGSLDVLSELLLKRIIQTYKYSNAISTMDLLFSSHGFADLIERLKYIQVAQSYDKKKLYELQATKISYNEQKQDKETRQQEAEKLNKDLEVYKKQLDEQKSAKEELLKITKNDEARYQSTISQLRAELASIAQAISNIGAKIGPVNKGDVIAGMGSTGCSTGPHLHFEVYQKAKVEGGRIVDKDTGESVHPKVWDYLVNPHGYIDNNYGSPLSGYPGGDMVITTEFRQWYQFFGGTYHTGLDIAPKGGGGLGRPIYAAENGIAYATSGSCSSVPPGGTPMGKGVVIDHQNGIVTLYWHIL